MGLNTVPGRVTEWQSEQFLFLKIDLPALGSAYTILAAPNRKIEVQNVTLITKVIKFLDLSELNFSTMKSAVPLQNIDYYS